MSLEEEKKVIYIREEIGKMIEKADFRRLKLIYQYIRALMRLSH